jgi:amino acid transporter
LSSRPGSHRLRPLGPLLCFGIVHASVGSHAYWAPGVVFRDSGAQAAAFVLAAGLAFALLAEKLAEVAERHAGGGGAVSVASDAFGDTAGALAGALLLVDYVLLAAVSAVAGFTQLAAVFPALADRVTPLALAGLAWLGLLVWTGVRGAAAASAAASLAALATLAVLAGAAGWRLQADEWRELGTTLGQARELAWPALLAGFATACLAFGGLESLAHLSPAMAPPRRRTARRAALALMAAALATLPLLTALATTRIDPVAENPGALLVELTATAGVRGLGLAVALSGAVALLFAANTALVGACHACSALAQAGFLPGRIVRRSRRFGTPAVAILAAVVRAGGAIRIAHGDVDALAHVYAFGLLGALALTSLAVDRQRLRRRALGPAFAAGLAISLLFLAAWAATAVARPQAALVGVGSTLALLGAFSASRAARRRSALAAGAPGRGDRAGAAHILTLPEALELRPAYTPKTILCLRGPNERLLEEALVHLRGQREWEAAVLFVDEIPGIFVPRENEPSAEARAVLADATAWLGERGVAALPIWRLAHDAGDAIADAARQLGAEAVVVGASRRGAAWQWLRGSVVARLVASASERMRVVVVG